jgi:HEPN domain-containing protein
LPRKTNSLNPADWILIAESDMELVRAGAKQELGFAATRSKLAEVLEKVLKAELIRTGWELEKTHDLNRILQSLAERNSDIVPVAEPWCDGLAQVYFVDRYPGFDLDDPDWPKLRAQVEGVAALLETVKSRLPAS